MATVITLTNGVDFELVRTKLMEEEEKCLENAKCSQTPYKPLVVTFMTKQGYKTKKQNDTFHTLLELLWDSDCSSYVSYNDMKWKYKDIAGLVEVEYQSGLSAEDKKMIWEAVKILPLSEDGEKKMVELLKGKIVKGLSWGDAKKEKATAAIDSLIGEMLECQVQTSKVGTKFNTVMKKLKGE